MNPMNLRRPLLLVFAAALAGCGSDASSDESPAGTGGSTQEAGADAQHVGGSAGADATITGGASGSPDASLDAKPEAEASVDAAAETSIEAAADAGSPKESLSACWLDPSCHRALVVAHGGEWDQVSTPFLSRKAFEKAWQTGADGIEADILVTKDGIPVVAHSSPIEYYESIDCGGKKIEEMTADDVTGCHLGVSTETFQRMDDVLAWSKGKLIMEWDVKLTADLPAAIATIIASGAQDRTFILVGGDEIQGPIPAVTGWEQVYYMVRIGAGADVAPQLAIAPTHNVFLFELDRSYGDATEVQVTSFLVDQMIPAGVKGFTSSDKYVATVQNHVDVFHQGFDVVLSYNVPNGVAAAKQINGN